MTIPPATPAVRAPRSRWRGPLIGVGVFMVIIAGWMGTLFWSALVEARGPLPDSGGSQGRCAVWFIGSSSIARWPALPDTMRPWHAHNRGILGATIRQLLPRFASEEGVAAPAAIVFYAGDNDIARGEHAGAALADLRRFLAVKDRRLGAVPVLLLSVKYSPARWHFRDRIAAFNDGLRRLAAGRRDLFYVDVASSLMIGGRPGDYFEADGIHIRLPGYRRWDAVVLDALNHDVRGAAACASPPARGA